MLNLRSLRRLLLTTSVTAILPIPAVQAGVTVYQLGEQDFAAGAAVPVSASRVAGANEAYPFNGRVFGDDRIPSFGRINFTYFFPSPTAAGDGVLTLGLIGLDAVPGSRSTVRLSLNGISQPTDPFVGVSSPLVRSSSSVVSVPVPASLLAAGQLDVEIQAIRAGSGFPGNAIQADFSTLTVPTAGVIGSGPGTNPGGPGTGGGTGGEGTGNPGGGSTEHPPTAVPLPPALLLALPGLALAWRAKRNLKRRA